MVALIGEHIMATCPVCGDDLRAFVVDAGVREVELRCPRCIDVTVVMERTPADNPYQPEHYQLVGRGWRVASVSMEGGTSVAIPTTDSATTATQGPADAGVHDGSGLPAGRGMAVHRPDVRGLSREHPQAPSEAAPTATTRENAGLRGAKPELSPEYFGGLVHVAEGVRLLDGPIGLREPVYITAHSKRRRKGKKRRRCHR